MSDEDEFQSLAGLLFDVQCDLGDLATKIETDGVFGWDRFDRLKRFKPDDPECGRALDRLARQRELDDLWAVSSQEEDLDPTSDPLWFFGWPRSELQGPGGDFAEPKSRIRRSDIARTEMSNLHIIGALLLVIDGELDCSRHPDFASETAMIVHVAPLMKGYQGTSKRTLEKRFHAARKLIGSTDPQGVPDSPTDGSNHELPDCDHAAT